MREGVRRELLIQKVIAQEVGAKVGVSDQAVTDFFLANRSQFNVPEEAYHIAQIVITPVADPNLTNRSGDDATTPQAAMAKAQMLMDRLKGGAAFAELAMGFSEDAETAPRGGDLGLIPVSKLKQLPPQLRDAVLNKTPGSVNVASANGGHTLVLVISHEQAGQRANDQEPAPMHACCQRRPRWKAAIHGEGRKLPPDQPRQRVERTHPEQL